MRIYHTRPTPFNFLNGTRMGFVLNKRGGVGMEATRPKPAPLPFLHLILSFSFLYFVLDLLLLLLLFVS